MWPGSPVGTGRPVFDRSPRVPSFFRKTSRPGTTTEDRPCGARGRGLRDVSGDIQFWWLVRGRGLAADAEALPAGSGTGGLLLGQVLQQPAATADPQQQPAAAVVVVL